MSREGGDSSTNMILPFQMRWGTPIVIRIKTMRKTASMSPSMLKTANKLQDQQRRKGGIRITNIIWR